MLDITVLYCIYLIAMLFSGGLTEPSEEVMADFSKNREMRQARVDVLFKDYEVRHKCNSFKVNESKGEKNLCNPHPLL